MVNRSSVHRAERLAVLSCVVAAFAGAGTLRAAAQDGRPNADGWVSLFNGKDLTGWAVEGENPEAWRIEDDELLMNSAAGTQYRSLNSPSANSTTGRTS